jgi:hypothetical protein
MPKHSLGQLWHCKKGDHVTVNGIKLLVEKVDSFDPADDHEEHTKEIHLKGKDAAGREGDFLIELSDSMRSFYRIDKPDSFTTKKVELQVHSIHPE